MLTSVQRDTNDTTSSAKPCLTAYGLLHAGGTDTDEGVMASSATAR